MKPKTSKKKISKARSLRKKLKGKPKKKKTYKRVGGSGSKQKLQRQERKSAAEPDESARDKLNSVSDFLLDYIRPEIRDKILKYSGIEIYYKLKEKHLPKLYRKLNQLKKRRQEIDENFSANYPEGTMYDLEENYNKQTALLKEIKKYIEILDKKGIYKHNSNL